MREKRLFNSDWYFYHGEKCESLLEKDLTGFAGVELPHDWSLDYPLSETASSLGSGGHVETGIGFYKKIFHVDKDAKCKKTVIRFDGAYMLTTVWINGHELGTHVYGYTPFEYDVSDYLNYDGDNVIAAKVDNSRQPNSRWYTGSGITRDVWIMTLPKTHISSYGVYAKARRVSDSEWFLDVKTEIENKTEGTKITCILDRNGMSVTGDEKGVKVLNPDLWTAKNPNLYTLTVRLSEDDEVFDEVSIKTGFRETYFDADKGFVINGESVKLNGVCLHHDGGSVGAAVPKCVWERRLKKLKDMGCNAIRCSHNPPNSDLLDLCDELGFYVMDESFDEWDILKWKTAGSNTDNSKGYSEYFNECHEEDMTLMLKRDRNHPSVVIWSIGNEIPNQTDEKGHLLARKLKEMVRQFDDRPITVACDQIEAEPRKATEEFLDELDVVGYNYTGRWRKRAETLYDDDKRRRPDRCIIGSENPSPAGVRGKYLMDVINYAGWYTYPYYSSYVDVGRLLRYTMTHDYVSGDFMWTGVDYLGEAGWPNRNASSGVLDTCGLEKDSYYFYKSIWNREDPMVHALPNWNLDIEKGKIVQMLVFTNCEQAELFLNGKSYGIKAYSYPAYGMTEKYGHFDKEPIPVCTDNLFLSWDLPYDEGEVVIKGYENGVVVTEEVLKTATAPANIKAELYKERVSILDRDVLQLEVSLLDKDGDFCSAAEDEITVTAIGAKVIGCNNGNPKDHSSLRTDHIKAMSGKAFFILKPEKIGECEITVTAGKAVRTIKAIIQE